MSTPWDILGLATDQRDRRSIKRAYAKLLKQHRPDQDPEGFRRLHDAYQWALRMADDDEEELAAVVRSTGLDLATHQPAHQPVVSVPPLSPPETQGKLQTVDITDEEKPLITDVATETTVPVPTPSDVSPPAIHPSEATIVPALPTERSIPGSSGPPARWEQSATPWELALADLERAAGQPPGPLRSQALATSFRQLAKLVSAHLGSSESLIELLNRHLPDGPQTWRHIFTDDDLLAELRSGGSDLTANTLKGCFDNSEWDRLIGFAKRWLNEGDSIDFNHHDAIIITRALAVWIAMIDYPLAQHLLQQFPAHVLRAVDEELDQVMIMGREARELPVGARRYVCDLIRGKESRDATAIRDRAQLLAYVTRIPANSRLGRLLHHRLPGYITPPQPHRGTEVPLNLLSLLLTAIVITLFSLGVWFTTSLNPGGGMVSLVVVALIVGLIGGGIWTYRACAPFYFRSVRPWLWERFGPFDVPCKLLLIWFVAGLAIPALAYNNASGLTTLAVLCSFPLVLLAIRWGRMVLAVALTGVPEWATTGQRLRAVVSRCSVPGSGELKFTGILHLLWCGIVALPAMISAAVLVVGLALCPAWAPHSSSAQFVAIMAWSAPWVIASLVIHAILRHWWVSSGKWWKPFLVLGWCCWLPAVPWTATMLMVWIGQANEPAGINTGIFALLVAALLPVIVLRRLRRP